VLPFAVLDGMEDANRGVLDQPLLQTRALPVMPRTLSSSSAQMIVQST